MEDDYNLPGDVDEDSIYGGAASGLRGFQRFMRRVQSKPGLLPAWWSAEKTKECERVGRGDLGCAVEKSDLIEHYKDPMMPMQLRMFGEQIYGSGPGGQSGTMMRQQMMMMET